MTVINNATLILKDSQGNIGIVKSFTDKDITKISNAITDVGQVVDPVTHMPIEATKTSAGVVQLATAQDITNGTAGKVVDAQELNNFAQTLPSVNGVTDVSSGDNSNQIVVSKFGGNKTLTIDNVEHAGNADEATHASQADTAASANSVAWTNVSDKPSTYTPSSHTHDDRYYTKSEVDTKLNGKSSTSHNHDSVYLKLSGGNITGNLTVQNKNVVRSVNGVNADVNGNVQIGFPSDTFINVTSFPFTAPSDGWITVRAVATASIPGAYVLLETKSSGGIEKLISISARYYDTETTTGDTLPVKKGDIVNIAFNNMRLVTAKFFYAEGEI